VGWFPSNYTTEDCDNDGEIHTYAMAENVLDIVVGSIIRKLSLSRFTLKSFVAGGSLQFHIEQ